MTERRPRHKNRPNRIKHLHNSKKSSNFAAESCKEYLKQRIYYYVVHFNSYGLVMFN